MTETAPPAEDRLSRMTYTVASEDLRLMVLDRAQLPEEIAGFDPLREGELDNEALAKRSGADTLESLTDAHRLNGYESAFAVAQGASTLAEEPAALLEASTAVHLFERPDNVRDWIDGAFVARLRSSVGTEDGEGRRTTGVELLRPPRFHGHSAGLLVVQDVPGGELASTIVEFQLGRVLGVVAAVAKVDRPYLDLAAELGARLERQIVRTVLGS